MRVYLIIPDEAHVHVYLVYAGTHKLLIFFQRRGEGYKSKAKIDGVKNCNAE